MPINTTHPASKRLMSGRDSGMSYLSTDGRRNMSDGPAFVAARSTRSGHRARLDVVHEQRVLIANVQASITNRRMRPARQALIGNAKTSFLAVARRRRLRQPEDIALALNVKMAIGEGHRTFADTAIPPHHLARRELEAGQDRIVEPV